MAMLSLDRETTISKIVSKEQERIAAKEQHIEKICDMYGIKTYNDLCNIIALVDELRELNVIGKALDI